MAESIGMILTLKNLIRRGLNRNGVFVYKRPAIFGLRRVSESFAPRNAQFQVGKRESYFIHEGYHHRSEPIFCGDDGFADFYQREVYQFASEVCGHEHFDNVCDIGCGSAYKLMRYLGKRRTIGIDIPETCVRLRKRWPHRTWVESVGDTFAQYEPPWPIEMVIASDVVEHLLDPDAMMSFIERLQPRKIIMSTPERNLIRDGAHDGPPSNPAHIREWSFAEFEAYVGSWFDVQEHFISCASQATQCVLCAPRLL
jgi:hypothetical protein